MSFSEVVLFTTVAMNTVVFARVVHLALRVGVGVTFATAVLRQSHLIVMSTLVSASVVQASLDASVTNANRVTGTTVQGGVRVSKLLLSRPYLNLFNLCRLMMCIIAMRFC